MPMNKELFNKLNDLDFLREQNETKRNQALDSLLALALDSTAEQFIAAVKNHKKFWGNELIEDIELDGLDPKNAEYSLKKIQQLAAEQRVKLGLKGAEQDTLVWILTHNTEEVRAYLATKKTNFGPLDAIPGWLPSVKVPATAAGGGNPINKSVNALTDASIDNIKKEASAQLLTRLLRKATDPAILAELLIPAKRVAALNKLGYPPTAPDVELTLEHVELIGKLQIEAAKTGIDQYIAQLSDDEILDFADALEEKDENLENFNEQLDAPFKDKLDQESLEAAKEKVALRYIQVVVPAKENLDEDLLAILNQEDLEPFSDALFELPSLEYIDAIDFNRENAGLIRKALLHGLILKTKDIDSLLALDTPDPLGKLREVLQNKFNVTSHDWINDSDLKEIKQWAREQAFLLQLNKLSPYGAEKHKEVIAGFKQLSVTQQRKLLKDEKAITNLLKAETSAAVGLLLGHEIKNANKIAEENQALNGTRGLFYAIHNKELARFLAQHPKALSVDQDKVDALNAVLVAADPAAADPASKIAKDLNVAGNYTDVVNKVIGLFDLDVADFVGFKKDDLITQQKKNEFLLKAYYQALVYNTAEKELITFLMHLDTKFDATALQKIQARVAAAMTFEEFKLGLNSNTPPDSLSDPIKKELSKHFSPSLFQELKHEQMEKAFNTPNIEHVKRAIKSARAQLDDLKSKFEILTKNADSLEPLARVADIHLMNPAFQGKARNESVGQLKRFQDLAHQCDLVVDQLLRMKADLLGMNSAMPDDYIGAVEKSFQKLEQEIFEQVQQIDQRLEFYAVLQNKLRGDDTTVGVLQTLEDAAQGRKTFVHQFKEIACSVVNRSDLEAVIANEKVGKEIYARTTVGSAEVIVDPDRATALPWLLADNLSADQLRLYELKHKTAAGTEFRGVFTEEHKPNHPTEPEGKFVVRDFPNGRPSLELQDMQVKFTLAMAVQSLASLDSLPTPDKPIKLQGNDPLQLKMLYAAYMSMGLDKKAVYVESTAFNPETEHGAVWGFNNNSAKVTMFDTRKTMVDEAVARLKQEQGRKNDKTGERKKVEEGVKSATQDYKKKTELLKEAQAKVEKDGPAPKV